jgi:hypothetical protein
MKIFLRMKRQNEWYFKKRRMYSNASAASEEFLSFVRVTCLWSNIISKNFNDSKVCKNIEYKVRETIHKWPKWQKVNQISNCCGCCLFCHYFQNRPLWFARWWEWINGRVEFRVVPRSCLLWYGVLCTDYAIISLALLKFHCHLNLSFHAKWKVLIKNYQQEVNIEIETKQWKNERRKSTLSCGFKRNWKSRVVEIKIFTFVVSGQRFIESYDPHEPTTQTIYIIHITLNTPKSIKKSNQQWQ